MLMTERWTVGSTVVGGNRTEELALGWGVDVSCVTAERKQRTCVWRPVARR